MEKVEIARRQLDGAIRARLLRHDAIVSVTLAQSASQLLRDLNIGNPNTLSGAITALAHQVGENPGKLWSEFNKNSGAHDFKHARDSKVFEKLDEVLSHVDGLIMFALCEYMILNQRTVSHHMWGFASCVLREEKRTKRQMILASSRNAVDRLLTLTWADTKVAFFGACLDVLERLQARLRLTNSAASTQ